MKKLLLPLIIILFSISSLGRIQDYAPVRSGPVASRPTCSDSRVMWFVTDSGSQRWTYCDGVSWSDIAPGFNASTIPIAQIPTGTSSSAVTIGNDSRITSAAPLASPTFTGTPTLPTGTIASGSFLNTNIAAPGTPTSGKNSTYIDSTDLRFHDKNASGIIGTTVVADTGASNNFLTAISVAGAISKVQPTFANLASTPTTLSGYGITDAVATTRTISTTSPLGGGGDLSANRTFTCTTCATTTNGGALSGTSPVTVSAAGVIACSTCLIGNQTVTLSGDITGSGATSITTVNVNLPDGVTQAGHLLLTDIAAPASPGAAKLKVFGDSTDLRFHDKNAAGTIGTTVVSDVGASNNFLTAVSAAGVISKAQPSFTNVSGSVAASQLPNPTSSTLGGIQSLASVASKWINTISTSGVPSATQPAFTDVSGSVAASQMPALTGDITTVAGNVATTLATVATAGTTGSSTAIPVVTINVKGLTTTITTAAVVAPAGTLTGATLASGVTASSLTSVGTLASPALTTPTINHPTIGISGTSASSHVLTVGTAPTCAFTSGGGSSPSCALETGSTDHAGAMTITTGSGSPAAVGTITLTFNATMGTNSPACICSLTKGATDWSISSTVRVTTQSTTAPVFSWASQSATAAVSLTASTNYKISYICFAK